MTVYEHQGRSYRIDLTPLPDGRWQVTIGDSTLMAEAQPLPDGGWLLTLDGSQSVAYVAAHGNERFVHANGQTVTLAVPQTRASRQRGGSARGGDADHLTAQMPGQVIEVNVSEGEVVRRGQTLVVLEAMKMEMRVTAPADGRVTRVLVTPGDVVERGQPLVELEDA